MATRVLPDSPAAFKDATWDDVLPYYEDLATRPLDTHNVEDWLADWSRFESLVGEAASWAYFEYSQDTANPDREAAQLRFGTKINPLAQEQRVRLQERLVELGYTRPGLEIVLQKFRNQMELFDAANVPPFAQLSELSTQWAKVNGAMTVQWEG
jgi:oligoendopeptidase F